jgi:hypothetical protein
VRQRHAPELGGLFSTGMPAGAVFDGGYTVDNGADPHNADFYLGKSQEYPWERPSRAGRFPPIAIRSPDGELSRIVARPVSH